ncbi:uncharacterized protein LOC131929719 [Physella acuta]|uniref:uncharacterized protein LOC131929719 n=1 Tax=Physella acuta TaxID=109671 RepID=UPI0027DABB85|nr:uncharacterized protein LOC131929719 [Physella acuta]
MDPEDSFYQQNSLISFSSGSDSARGDSNDSSGSFNSARNTVLQSLKDNHRLRTATSYNPNIKDSGSCNKNVRITSSRKRITQDKGSSIDSLRSLVTDNHPNIHEKNSTNENVRSSSKKNCIRQNDRSHPSRHRGCKTLPETDLENDVDSKYSNTRSESSQRSRLGSDLGVLMQTPEVDHSVQNVLSDEALPELRVAASMTFDINVDYISGSDCLAPPQPHLIPEVRQTHTSHNRTSADSMNLNRRQLPPLPSQTGSETSCYISYDQPVEPVKRVRRREPRHSLHARRSLILITMLSVLLSLASVGFLVLLITRQTPSPNNKLFKGLYEACVECLESFDHIDLLTVRKEKDKSFCCATLDDQMYALVLMIRNKKNQTSINFSKETIELNVTHTRYHQGVKRQKRSRPDKVFTVTRTGWYRVSLNLRAACLPSQKNTIIKVWRTFLNRHKKTCREQISSVRCPLVWLKDYFYEVLQTLWSKKQPITDRLDGTLASYGMEINADKTTAITNIPYSDILLFGCEAWTVNLELLRRIHALDMRCLRRHLWDK